MEIRSVYDSINMTVGIYSVQKNQTASGTQIGQLLCPSESRHYSRRMTNYAGNLGSTYDSHSFNGLALQENGRQPVLVRWSDVTDGISVTALTAEWLNGLPRSESGEARRLFFTEISSQRASEDEFVRKCVQNKDIHANDGYLRGRTWITGSWAETLYDHGVPINSPGCLRDTSAFKRGMLGSCSAGSQHPHGAHVGFADGHVRFVQGTISLPIWRAIGSRNGGEIVPDL